MKYLFSVFFLFFSFQLIAQTPIVEWQKSLGGSGDDRAYSVAQTFDGGYIATGFSKSDNGDVKNNHGKSSDYWIVKLTTTGMVEWQRTLGSFSLDWGSQVIATADSGYLVSGLIYGNGEDVTDFFGGVDCWIVKLNKKGDVLWEKSFGGTGADGNSYEEPIVSIIQTSDGGYIMATATWSNDGQVDLNHGIADYWVIKLNDTGKIEWQKTYGGSDYDVARSIKQTEDGGFIVLGESRSSDGDITAPLGGGDYWVLKLTKTGAVEWQKNYGGSQDDVGYDIVEAADGYVLAGYSSSSDGNVTGHHYSSDFWVVKIDKIGKLLWQKSIGGSAGEFAKSICKTSDGNYVVAGSSYSFDGDAIGGHREADYWIVKMSDAGSIIWQYKIGGWNMDFCNQIKETKDKGFIIAGYSTSNDGEVSHHRGDNDYWIVKLGYPRPSSVGELNNKRINIYPNPAADVIIIDGISANTKFSITDMVGKEVYTGETLPERTQVSLNFLSPGTYIFKTVNFYQQLISIIK